MPIRLLPETLINRIAAGEVIERPAAVVKELVENAIDAGATRVDVSVRDGGRSMISIVDDGCGMTPDELVLAVERHATSKLLSDDLLDIHTLGFRGEALPSIGAVSHLTVASRPPDAEEGWAITVDAGRKDDPRPASLARGTRIEVRDLFAAVPARLKFLKSARAEMDHIVDTLERLSMAHPEVAFTLTADGRSSLRLSAGTGDLFQTRLERLGAVMGRDFKDNAVLVQSEREGVGLSGWIGLPTLNRPTAAKQYLFVNGRPVRDKLMVGAVRAGYADLLPRDRHPLLALFLSIDSSDVDVNVHPAKAEVRFRDAGLVRGLIVGALRHALDQAGHRAANTVSLAALGSARPEGERSTPRVSSWGGGWGGSSVSRPSPVLMERAASYQAPLGGTAFAPAARPPEPPAPEVDREARAHRLGAARAQLHATYIVAQTDDGMIIVDQHAAHERIVHERMKAELIDGKVKSQALLLPEVVELDARAAERLVRRGARGAGALGPNERQGPRSGPRRGTGGAGRHPGLARTDGGGVRDARLSRLGPGGTGAGHRGDERVVADDGGDAKLRPMQPRAPDVCRAEARRYREVVRAPGVLRSPARASSDDEAELRQDLARLLG